VIHNKGILIRRISLSALCYLMMTVVFLLSSAVHNKSFAGPVTTQTLLKTLKLPPGFTIELFADNLPNARTMVESRKGIIFVGTRQHGAVYALKGGKRYIIAEGLNMPNGIAFYQDALYVASVDKIVRYDNIEDHLSRPPRPVVIRNDLPRETHHGWRYIAFDPDNRLTLSIGAPCNVCLEPAYAQIRSMKPDGTDERVIAKGVRNSVGFTWHPQTKKLWFSDNGRDRLGDDIPFDEINRLDQAGEHFGFPYCHGGTVSDPVFKQYSCRNFKPPAWQLDAHVAPLGIAFYTGKAFPASYRQQLFVAEHGSWNRSSKVGYKVIMLSIKGDKVLGEQPFITGWLQGQKAWGRPAYILVLKDGSMLVSDDKRGAIYRVSYLKRPQ